ncbi:MAG: TRAP transporter large permease [Betaproteobacteria bacterium]|jgi:tripartite ATP-independent transporter DctM subunit|nr:TRAP transporter large permease [Betaproteobacteria bacterium]MBK8107073.1 TRAP transporter large permease [Betaproteobacteria bacterium]
MSVSAIGFVSGAALLVLLLLGLPVAFSMALVGVAGLLFIGGAGPALGLLATVPYATVASFSLVVIPMFVLMGELVASAGFARQAYAAARLWFGRLPGGLAISAIGASAFFAAVSGSSVAATATMGRLSIAEMRRHGYEGGFAAGTVVVAGTLAALIPPSAMLVFYALVTDQSVSRMLFAGVGPGVLSAVLFMVTAWMVARRNPTMVAVPEKSPPWAVRIASLKAVGPFGVLIFVVLGGIYSGLVTVTEASALGALCALILLAASRQLNWSVLNQALTSSVRISCMIYLIIIGGLLYSRFLAYAGIPFAMVTALQGFDASPLAVVIAMLGIMTVLGMFMDPVGMIMLTLPFFFPIVKALGVDPIWFGVLVVLQAELAVITPPVGVHLFVARQIAPDIPLSAIIRGSLPFMFCQFLVLALVLAFPQIALWLPGHLAP